MLCKKGCCLICNCSVALVGPKAGVDLFGNQTILKSSKKLCETVSEILNKLVTQDSIHTNMLCYKCWKIIIEYDYLSVRCKTIQTNLIEDFKKTLTAHNLDYSINKNDNLKSLQSTLTVIKKVELDSSKSCVKNNPQKGKDEVNMLEGKRLVVPASKLQPLPPNFHFNSGSSTILKHLSVAQSNVSVRPNIQPITIQNSNVTINLSGSMQGMPATKNNIVLRPIKTTSSRPIVTKISKTIDNYSNSEQSSGDTEPTANGSNTNHQTSESTKRELSPLLKFSKSPPDSEAVYTLNVTSLPKNFLANAIQTKVTKSSVEELDQSDGENVEESPMEIDEGSLTTLNPGRHNVTKTSEQSESGSEHQDKYAQLLPSHNIIQILDDKEEAEEHQLVMECDENCPIISLMGGQKIMFGDNEVSLVIPEDGHFSNQEDSQDSNDESQIELQVSGDEETANAIIAAAQEQGGAFIKVESGEMFRVQSVQSKEDDSEDEGGDGGEDGGGSNTWEDSMRILRKKNGIYRCLFCEYVQSGSLEIKESSTSGDQDTALNAFVDGVFEGDAASMMLHLKSAHCARIYICHTCGKFYRKKVDYLNHISEHADNWCAVSQERSPWLSKGHECNVCHRKFSTRAVLNEHSNVHAGARPYVCAVCGKGFATKYTHQAHMKTHEIRPRPFKCTKCDKRFFTHPNLVQHQKTHSGIREFVCTVCKKAFGTQHNLEVHGVVHSRNKPFNCTTCNKSFARRAELRDHLRIHTGERPYVCDVCGARFAQRSNLHSHRRATHMNDKRYACDICPKRFKRRRLLDYHIKASHTGERPLVCEICNATFVYPEHLKKHARVHSGAKPYVCEICGKSFNSRDNRNTHRFVHSDRKPYECLVCGAGYMRKQLLYQHMNLRGHMAESIVVNQPRVTDNSEGSADTDGDKSNEPTETIIEVTEESVKSERELGGNEVGTEYFIAGDKQIILEDGKAINISEDCEATLLTIHNIDGELKQEREGLETITLEQVEETRVVTGGGGSLMRLVQVQLADGNSGWVAVDN